MILDDQNRKLIDVLYLGAEDIEKMNEEKSVIDIRT